MSRRAKYSYEQCLCLTRFLLGSSGLEDVMMYEVLRTTHGPKKQNLRKPGRCSEYGSLTHFNYVPGVRVKGTNAQITTQKKCQFESHRVRFIFLV